MPSRRNPFQEIEEMFERMGRQFERPFEEELGSISVDVEDRDDEYVVTADVPGFDRDDIDVEVEENTLHIRAEREAETEEEEDEGEFIHRERSRRSMSRSVRLPEAVDETEAEATYQNGVLTVTLPKLEEADHSGTDIPIN